MKIFCGPIYVKALFLRAAKIYGFYKTLCNSDIFVCASWLMTIWYLMKWEANCYL